MNKFSLIIPCYNESKSLPLLLKLCKNLVKNKNIEIIIVDNGSTDDTQLFFTNNKKKYNFVKLVSLSTNNGYGYGIVEGLKRATGDVLSWTHADIQTNPMDLLEGYKFFENEKNTNKIFVKGLRYGRPLKDKIFTVFMSLFESIYFRKFLWDINAQPTIFPKSFFLKWKNPPNYFSLDLYAYYFAKVNEMKIKRFDVKFGKRKYGVSSWNINWKSKFKFIERTIKYSLKLKNRI